MDKCYISYYKKKSFKSCYNGSSIILCSDGYVINSYDSEIHTALLATENAFLNWIGTVYITKELLRTMMLR